MARGVKRGQTAKHNPNTVRFTLPPVRRDTPDQRREKDEKIAAFLAKKAAHRDK